MLTWFVKFFLIFTFNMPQETLQNRKSKNYKAITRGKMRKVSKISWRNQLIVVMLQDLMSAMLSKPRISMT